MPRFAPHPARRPAIVTGASSGIGAATAVALAAAGYPVVLGARRVDRCGEVAARIRDDGGEAWAVRLDLADEASIKDFVDGATNAAGEIEIFVSIAGDAQLGHAATMNAPDFAQQVRVNLLGPQHLVSLIAPPMIERGRGDLIITTSDAVHSPRPGMAAYETAKAGLDGYAKLLQMELETTGVRATIVRPGPTASEMGANWDPDALPPLFDEWARWGHTRHDSFLRPAHVAQAIVAVVAMPRGSHIPLVEVQPEAPGPHDLQGGSS